MTLENHKTPIVIYCMRGLPNHIGETKTKRRIGLYEHEDEDAKKEATVFECTWWKLTSRVISRSMTIRQIDRNTAYH